MKKAIGGCALVIAVFAVFAYLILMNEDRRAEEGQAKAGVGQIDFPVVVFAEDPPQ